ncbi:MAG: SDR family oxidoreductase [Armatimonadetes bacterium]|nr:SDR family oxidoreductase [Armatimonadota bacterium]
MIHTGLENRVALITGANNPQGIGAGIARSLAAQGARVCLHYFRTHQSLEGDTETAGEGHYHAQQAKSAQDIAREINSAGGNALCIEADLGDPLTPTALFDFIEKQWGAAEILVNNACYWESDTFLPPEQETVSKQVETWAARPQTFRPDVFDRLFAVDTRAVAHLMTEFVKRHIAKGATYGRIVNISTDGAHCFPSEVTYGAAKLAVEGYTRSAAVELGKFGITVNCISPGPIQTGWITPEFEKDLAVNTPLGRVGTPSDIADVAVFLASEQGRWVTGQVIKVNGGHSV